MTSFTVFDRVEETTASTGTGTITLAGVKLGFQSIASRYAVGKQLPYCIEAVDANGAATGDWEVGIGTHSAGSTLTRDTVLASSNAGALVAFAAGTKRVFVALSAAQIGWMRERLTAARTYYVRTDGSDSNTGLANTAGGAFLTIQKAADTITDTLDIGSQAVTIQVADGTYTGAVALRPFVGRGTVTIQGNAATPANVVVSVTSNNAFLAAGAGASYAVKDLKVATTTSGFGIAAALFGAVTFGNVDFGACAGGHLYCDQGKLTCSGNYAITGNAPVHLQVTSQGYALMAGKTITITGTPAFSNAFIYATKGGICNAASNTYSGSATGSRYAITYNAIVESGVTLPGNAAGSYSTGGQYI